MKVGILIPSTTRGRNWFFAASSYLYETLQSIKATADPEFEYVVYVGYDTHDVFYQKPRNQNAFLDVGLPIIFVPFADIQLGHLTKRWNVLAQQAYDEGCDYLYQCGDDIRFDTSGWVGESVRTLQRQDNIGVTGPANTNGNTSILTQTFVHRTHLDIFGFYFPEEIINWHCDNWINGVYRCATRLPPSFTCKNVGGSERYDIVNDSVLCTSLISKYQDVLKQFRATKTDRPPAKDT
jgi:hypothetical protein